MILDKQLAALDLRKVPDRTLLSILTAIQTELLSRSNEGREELLELRSFEKRNRGLRSRGDPVSFATLDSEDWSHLFQGGSREQKFYVYAHIGRGKRVDNLPFGLMRLPFYIGKGTGDRAYDLKRNQGHGALVRGMKESNKENSVPKVRILRSNLTEAEAFALESKLIYFFGTKYEIGKSGCLINIDIPKTPEWCDVRRKGITGSRPPIQVSSPSLPQDRYAT